MKKIILLFLLVSVFSCKGPNKPEVVIVPSRTAEEDSLYKIEMELFRKNYKPAISKSNFEKLLSNWDGSLPSLVLYTKKNLNDPKSFEHIETGYVIKEGFVKVRMIYRARNGFNALVKGSITAKVDSKGSIIEIIDSN